MSDAPQIDWDLVEDLVFQCLELRAAKAGGDAAIAALLAVHPDALVAQVRRVLGDVSSWGQSPPVDGPELRIPARLGPYTIGHRLGQGGMGAVYEARDEALGQKTTGPSRVLENR